MAIRVKRLGALLALPTMAAVAVGAGLWLRSPGEVAVQGEGCPAGYEAEDPLEISRELNPAFAHAHEAAIRQQFGSRVCVSEQRMPESMMEFMESKRGLAELKTSPAGALRGAVEQKAALAANKAKVANADGVWAEYGVGPQVGDEAYVSSANATTGMPEVAGRVDSFAYDPAAKRLFAAVGNGGIWMTQATGGDLATLGDSWQPIGDKLPILVNSAVAWTPAGGGRVLSLTGEHTQGGNAYVGLGAYWSDDLGETWNHSAGVPDGAFSFKLAVDPAHPSLVYAATSKGLFRSADAGASFVNVKLPVSAACAGVETLGPCQFANFVTDVVVKQPGGTTAFECGADGCPVLAAVGFRAGAAPYPDGTPQAPGNGLYRSDSGKAGSFARVGQPTPSGLLPLGFAPNARIGRVELGNAVGEAQNHDYVYAIVQDAVLLNGGFPLLDIDLDAPGSLGELCNLLTDPIPDPGIGLDPLVAEICAILDLVTISSTTFNGLYASSDFGDTWFRITDDLNLLLNAPLSGSSLAVPIPLGVGPGIQSWYDMWVKPDPTQQLAGIPTRITFGLEELWKNRLPLPPLGLLESTPVGLDVFGTYFAGDTCLFLIGAPTLPIHIAMPICPTYDGLINGTTTHPDQQDGFYIPDPDRGGVWLFAGNDGGVYKQFSSGFLDDFANNKWGNGANQGFYTLMHYGIAVARDGTVYYGNQDNASGKIEPDTRRQVGVWVGDGMWAAVDPDNSQTAYVATPGLSIVRTTDGGKNTTSIYTGADFGSAYFLSPFTLDPLDADHLVGAGSKVAETLNASTDAEWTTVFDLGIDEASGAVRQSRSRALDVRGDAVYVGYCGPCNLAGSDAPFQRGIATNVAGDKPPQKGSEDGWHFAAARGLPNRYIYNIHIDPQDTKTIYVALGGYSTARWAPPGQYLDTNPDIGAGHVYKSTDAGESFTDISGDLPDTEASAVIRRGDQLIVGSNIGVFISSDLNGSAWAPLGDLPAVPVNQLLLKPGDDTQLFAATFGRGAQLYDFDTAGSGGTTGGATTGSGGGGGGALGWLLLLPLIGGALRRRRAWF